MSATVLINNRQFLARFGLARDKVRRNMDRALDVAAQVLTKRIVERTGDGKEISGRAFAKYTEEYEEYKRNLQGVNYAGVNLQVTNDMLGSLTNTRPQNGKTTIFFAGKKNAQKAAGNQVKRPFFGFNKNDEKAIRKVFARELFK